MAILPQKPKKGNTKIRGAPGGNAHGNLLRIVTAPPAPGDVTGWESRQRTKAPLAKGGCLGTAEAGGFRRQSLRNFLPNHSSLFTKKPSPFHIGLYFEEVPTVNPSVKNQRFLPAPFSKVAFLRPVSFHGAIPGFFKLSIDSVGKIHPQTPQTQTGEKAETHHPEPKRRVNLPMVPPGGFSRGEQFERERVIPPLSRLLCVLSCRSKKVWPRWQAPGVPPVSISLGS